MSLRGDLLPIPSATGNGENVFVNGHNGEGGVAGPLAWLVAATREADAARPRHQV
jgi:hypothetical protein